MLSFAKTIGFCLMTFLSDEKYVFMRLTLLEAIGYSMFVFGGSSQFAAVEVLGDGGSVVSAAVAGLLMLDLISASSRLMASNSSLTLNSSAATYPPSPAVSTPPLYE